MSAGKILGLFKKGAKKAGGGKKKKGEKKSQWPSGTRVGIVGHTNSGKTCYFTVLNECCKTDRRLQVSVSDHATASEFLQNYRSIWGLSTAVESGTAVDLRGEQKFPEPTEKDQIIRFNATVDGSHKLSVVSLDYPGKAIDIQESGELKDTVSSFMTEADGLLFFYDPKLLHAELQNQAHVSSFVNVIEEIAPLGSRLPVPVALVVTKADILPGFSGEDQTILVPTGDESILAEDYDVFIQRVLASNRLQDNPTWAGTVREVLLKMRDFLRIVVGRTLDFQIFFSTHTGQTPEKIGTDIGRSIYKPPRKLIPAGVKEPMYWMLNAIIRNRRIGWFRKLSKWAAVLSVIWVVIFSIPFAYHFWYKLPEVHQVEEDTLKPYGGSIAPATTKELSRVSKAYSDYSRSWMVRKVFRAFNPPARSISEIYSAFDVADAEKRLESVIGRFTAVVGDTTLWPTVNPSDSTVQLLQEHERLLENLRQYQQGDSTGILHVRSSRVLKYWDLFTQALRSPNDTTMWNIIDRQVAFDQKTNPETFSKAEQELGNVLRQHEVKEVEKVVQQQTAVAFGDDKIDEINGNDRPSFRLGDAVRELRSIKAKLPSNEIEKRNMIDDYLADAKAWSRFRTYTMKVEHIPGNSHLHVEVVDPGTEPAWADFNQIFAGDEVELRWKTGQHIHISLDTSITTCHFGKDPADKKVFDGKYGLFELEKGLSFDNVGQSVTVRFDPPLTERLPKLE